MIIDTLGIHIKKGVSTSKLFKILQLFSLHLLMLTLKFNRSIICLLLKWNVDNFLKKLNPFYLILLPKNNINLWIDYLKLLG